MADGGLDPETEPGEPYLEDEVGSQVCHALTDAVFVHDPETGEILDVNQTACEMYGYDRSELRGLTVDELSADVQPHTTETAEEHIQRAVDGEAHAFEWEALDSDGTQFPVEVNMRRAEIEDQRLVIVVARDITERKERERELERREAYLDQASDIITVVDADGTVNYQGGASEEITGFASETAEGGPRFDHVHPDDREEAVELFEQTIEEPEGEASGELRVKTADGDWRWIEARGVNRLDDPLIEGVIVSSRDITERKRQEQALRELTEQYEAVFENAADAIFLVDVVSSGQEIDFRFERVNPAHEATSGFTTAEIRGKTPREVLGDELGAEVRENYRRCVNAREPITYEEELPMPAGRIVWQTRLAPVIVDGEVTRIVGISRDITERRERERELERYEQLWENLPIGAGRLDPSGDGRLIAANERLVDIIGADTEAALLDRPIAELWWDRDEAGEFRDRIVETGHATSEARFRTLDGRLMWGRVTSFAREIGGDLVADFVLQDVTERRQREMQMQEAQKVGDIGWWRKDIPSDTIYWSDRVYEMWGVEGEEGPIDHERFLESVHPDDVAYVDKRWEAAKAGELYDVEHRIITGDGEEKWMREKAELTFDEDGDPVSAVGIVQDITERKERERELERYHAFVENSSDVITLLGEDGRGKYVSPSVERELGYDPETLIGRSGFDDIHPDDRERAGTAFEEILADPDAVRSAEYRIKTADGSWVWVEARGRNYLGVEPIDGILLNVRNISQRKEYEQELERSKEQLLILNRIVRHDIRNDMTIALGWSRELEQHLDADGEEILDRIESTSQHVVDLTKTVRDFVEAMETGDEPDVYPTALRPSLEEEVDKCRAAYPGASFTVEDEIPQVQVTANELLASVFRNVLNNAVQHNDSDDPTVEIDVAQDPDSVTVRFADNGPGIPDSQKEAIFGRSDDGLDDPAAGLGLYLVNTLVSEYGGEVWVEDNEPEGAVFVVELPKAT